MAIASTFLRCRIPSMVALAASICVTTLVADSTQAQKREQIRIVGSSTVYPFSSAVAEEFGQTTRYQTPVVESTGSGGGHKLFSEGVGVTHPDLTNSSRKMKESEFERCKANGLSGVTEAVIGYDGIAFAQHNENEPFNVTIAEITLAVAKMVPNPNGSGLVENPYKFWNEINPELPRREIKIYGPPTTSGTRDAFGELCMEAATKKMDAYEEEYSEVRTDGVWVDSGENDNLIVQKLAQDKSAFGVFGYSFLEENRDQIQGSKVGGVEPTPDSISSGDYPLSRSLYFYIKHDHLRVIPGMYQYVELFMDDKMIGPEGYLKKIGLVPLPDGLRKASQHRVLNLEPLTLVDGKLETLQQYAKANGFIE